MIKVTSISVEWWWRGKGTKLNICLASGAQSFESINTILESYIACDHSYFSAKNGGNRSSSFCARAVWSFHRVALVAESRNSRNRRCRRSQTFPKKTVVAGVQTMGNGFLNAQSTLLHYSWTCVTCVLAVIASYAIFGGWIVIRSGVNWLTLESEGQLWKAVSPKVLDGFWWCLNQIVARTLYLTHVVNLRLWVKWKRRQEADNNYT